MRAGLLRHAVILQRVIETPDATGDLIETWSNLATRRAVIEPLRGDERFTSDQERAEVTHRIRLRHGADIADLAPKDRVLFGARILDIVLVRNLTERSHEFELTVREDV